MSTPTRDLLSAALRAALAAGCRDPRHVVARLCEAGAGAWRVESDDPGVLSLAVPKLAALDARVDGVLLPGPELRDRAAWVAASVAEVRREPAHTAEQVSQALQGEAIVPLLHEDGWVLGRLPDGYRGWVRDWHLRLVPSAEPADFARRANARVSATLAVLYDAPQADAEACGETVLGTPVEVQERASGWARIELPAGRQGWMLESALRHGTGAWPADVPSLLGTLRRFMGVPYLWGGRSPKGFDCSGLVQFAYGLHGTALPRDSDEQAACGVAVETPAAGDLLFFGKDRVTHVAVATSPVSYLHARGEVRCNGLQPDAPLYDAELRSLWRTTRRVRLPAAAV